MLRHAHVPSATLSPGEVLSAVARPVGIEQAEARLGELTRSPTVLFASCRGALAAAVEVLAPGGNVALPGYTCMAVANAVYQAGAKAVWADVDRRGLVAGDRWPAADVCIVQDTYGFATAIPAGRPVIRDAAHRADAILDPPSAATVTVTSFEQSKWLSAGQGGVAVTRDGAIADALRRARDRHEARGAGRLHGLVTLLSLGAGRATRAGRRLPAELLTRATIVAARDRAGGQSDAELTGNGIEPGLLGRPPGVVATLALSQLARVAEVSDHRRAIVRCYDEAAGVARDPEPLVRYPLEAEDPDAVARSVRAVGWELGRPWFVSPLHPCVPPPPTSGYSPGAAPGGERLSRHVVNLPTDPLVDLGEARMIVDAALSAGSRPLV